MNSTSPTWRTRAGRAVHGRAIDHMPAHTRKDRFDKSLATWVTTHVGTMNCAYLFSGLALCSLPAVLSAFHVFHSVFPNWMIRASVIALVAWVAQTLIQLVLLSVIMVGQQIAQDAADARAAKQFEDVETVLAQVQGLVDTGGQILDRLSIETPGGISDVVSALKPARPARSTAKPKPSAKGAA